MNHKDLKLYEVYRAVPDPEVDEKPYGFYADLVERMTLIDDGVIVTSQNEAQSIQMLLRRRGFKPRQFTIGKNRLLVKIIGYRVKK